MSHAQFEKMPLQSLEALLMQTYNKLLELELEEEPNETAVQKINAKIDQIAETIKSKTEKLAAGQNVQNEQKINLQVQKELQVAFRDNVPTFQSGVDVHSFINSLELYYKLYVVPNKTADTEKMFVRLSTGKMSVEYGSTMTNFEPKIEDFESMKKYLKINHSSKMSCYQTLDGMWDLQISESENFRDFARKLDDKAVEARNIIEAKFETAQTKTAANNSLSADKSSETADSMTSKDVFNLFSGQIFLQMLKHNSPNIYNQIVNDLDAVWNAVDIANLAMSYKDRMASDAEMNQATSPSSLTAAYKSKNDRKNETSVQNCWFYINGNCRFGEKCHRSHDPFIKKAFENASLKLSADGTVIDKNAESEEKSEECLEEERRAKSLLTTLNSQVFRH